MTCAVSSVMGQADDQKRGDLWLRYVNCPLDAFTGQKIDEVFGHGNIDFFIDY